MKITNVNCWISVCKNDGCVVIHYGFKKKLWEMLCRRSCTISYQLQRVLLTVQSKKNVIFMTKHAEVTRVDTKTKKKNKRNINNEDVRILTFWNLPLAVCLANNSVQGSPHTCSTCAHMHFSPMRLLPAGTLPRGFNTYLIIILHYVSYIHTYTVEKGLNVYIVHAVCTL